MSTNHVSTNHVSTNHVSTNDVSTNHVSTAGVPTNHVSTAGVPTDPPATDQVTVADPAVVASRQCSRCRVSFPVDDTLLFTAEYAWWLCPTCSSALLGKPSR